MKILILITAILLLELLALRVVTSPYSKITPVKNPSPLTALINKERTARGLNPVMEVKEINETVTIRLKNIYSKNQWSHDGLEEAIHKSGLKGNFGENLASGFPPNQDERLVRKWMASQAHAETLLDKNYRYIGVARLGTYAIIWMTDLGK